MSTVQGPPIITDGPAKAAILTGGTTAATSASSWFGVAHWVVIAGVAIALAGIAATICGVLVRRRDQEWKS